MKGAILCILCVRNKSNHEGFSLKAQKGMEENKKVRGEDRGTGLRRVQYYI